MEIVWTELPTVDPRETSVVAQPLRFVMTDGFPFRSWRREECALVCWRFENCVLRAYGACQFRDHSRDRDYAKVWARLPGIFLP